MTRSIPAASVVVVGRVFVASSRPQSPGQCTWQQWMCRCTVYSTCSQQTTPRHPCLFRSMHRRLADSEPDLSHGLVAAKSNSNSGFSYCISRHRAMQYKCIWNDLASRDARNSSPSSGRPFQHRPFAEPTFVLVPATGFGKHRPEALASWAGSPGTARRCTFATCSWMPTQSSTSRRWSILHFRRTPRIRTTDSWKPRFLSPKRT